MADMDTTYNDVADWDIGDSVPFKLIGSIPDMSAYDTYEYIFTDTSVQRSDAAGRYH